MRRLVACAFFALACLAASCAGDDDRGASLWTERQAESIASVRSLPIHSPECRGLGGTGGSEHPRFDCVAGARAAWDTYDTIAVFYVLHPLAAYEGPRSRHRLTDVRFVGGPGVP